MKGLLIKDFRLMKQQVKLLFVLIFVTLAMTFMGNEISFIIGYLAVVMPLVAISTITYDEFDNGNAFLFSLPISRAGYVLEKYLFCTIVGVVTVVTEVAIFLGVGALRNTVLASEILLSAPIAFAVMLIVLSLMLPLHIKFGAEKSRIAMIIIFLAVFAIIFGALKIFPSIGEKVVVFMDSSASINPVLLILDIFLAAIIALFISVPISIGIMKKKEF